MNYNIDTEFFETYIENHIAIIKLKNDVYKLVTHLDESERLMDFIRNTEYEQDVHALFIVNEAGSYGEDMYNNFINNIIEQQSLKKKDAPIFAEKTLRFREINILNKMVMGFAEYQKLLYFGLVGEVVTPFFGASMTADFRIATKDTRFVLAHNKFGLHPTAALPFFLSQQLGHSKAMEIVLGKDLSSEEAIELGLLNELFPQEGFIQSCIEYISNHFACKQCTVRRTKQLINFSRKDLATYFKYEASLLNL